MILNSSPKALEGEGEKRTILLCKTKLKTIMQFENTQKDTLCPANWIFGEELGAYIFLHLFSVLFEFLTTAYMVNCIKSKTILEGKKSGR